MTNLADTSSAPIAAQAPATRDKRYLFNPVLDFLCLGGSSFILLPLLFILPEVDYRAPLSSTMILAAYVINHPHFAHSYQIFYRGYVGKAFHGEIGCAMQARYLFAGIGAPALIIGFFAFAILRGDARLLGYGANAMAFFVGWHYVKQGYGMLMVDAVLKRRFFKDPEKKVFLINSYIVWIFAWMVVNDSINQHNHWGLKYYTFAVPTALLVAGGIIATIGGLATAYALFSRWRGSGALPWNGVLAYFVSLYLWLLFVWMDPLWLLVVPALHSLQYLVVVWRYELNYEGGQSDGKDRPALPLLDRILRTRSIEKMALFVAIGILLGYLGFWGIPQFLDKYVPYDKAVFGGTMFLFLFWIFINIHHYFLDNVMWRRENPDTKKYLFG